MKQNEILGMKEFSLAYFFLTTSLCFFSFSALLMLVGDGFRNIFLWIAFITLLPGLFSGAGKIISWEKETGGIINDFSLYMRT